MRLETLMRTHETRKDNRRLMRPMGTSAVFRILWKEGQICVSGNEGGAKPPSLHVSTCKARGFGRKFYIQ